MNSYTLTELISHRAPMVLIDGLENYDDISAQCWVDITPDSLFFDHNKGGVPSYVGIEYMAQSIAAFAGALALDAGDDINIGFLLGSRKYKSQCTHFNAGDRLTIDVEELHREDSGLSVFECKISVLNQEVASAKVNVFQPDEPEKFIKEQL